MLKLVVITICDANDLEKRINGDITIGGSSAQDKFQINLIGGLMDNIDCLNGLHILNCGSYATWPKCKTIIEREKTFVKEHGKKTVFLSRVSTLNLPVLKQLTRTVSLIKSLREIYREKNEEVVVMIYSAYLPALIATKIVKKRFKTVEIIPDDPLIGIDHGNIIKNFLHHEYGKITNFLSKNRNGYILFAKDMAKEATNGAEQIIVEGMADYDEIVDDKISTIENSKIIICYAGVLYKSNEVSVFARIFNKINNPNFELWICGDGEEKKEIADLANDNPKIKYMGWLSEKDLINVMRNADVMLNPRSSKSLYTQFSFPSKTLFYLSKGKPVLMQHLKAIPAEYDSHLLYYSDNSENEIKTALDKINDIGKKELKNLGKRNAKWVNENKNPKTVSMKIIDFINKL